MKPIYVVLAAIGALLLFVFLGYDNLYNKAVCLQEGLYEKAQAPSGQPPHPQPLLLPRRALHRQGQKV